MVGRGLFMNPVLVLYTNAYDFKDDVSGRQITGFSIEYLELDQNPNGHVREGARGLTVFKDTLDQEALSQFKTVPGLYRLSHRSARDAKGKKTLRVNGGELVSKIDLAKLATPKVASPNN